MRNPPPLSLAAFSVLFTRRFAFALDNVGGRRDLGKIDQELVLLLRNREKLHIDSLRLRVLRGSAVLLCIELFTKAAPSSFLEARIG